MRFRKQRVVNRNGDRVHDEEGTFVLAGEEDCSLTSRTAHTLPSAKFMRRCVRWAKMSGVADMRP